jgi:hypothetical protein
MRFGSSLAQRMVEAPVELRQGKLVLVRRSRLPWVASRPAFFERIRERLFKLSDQLVPQAAMGP